MNIYWQRSQKFSLLSIEKLLEHNDYAWKGVKYEIINEAINDVDREKSKINYLRSSGNCSFTLRRIVHVFYKIYTYIKVTYVQYGAKYNNRNEGFFGNLRLIIESKRSLNNFLYELIKFDTFEQII